MRKTLMFGLGLATTLLATSCTKEENFNQAQDIMFSSSISSRATDTSFEKNDKIGISMTPGNITNVLYSTEDGTNFTSATPITYGMAGNVETVDFTAVYPYKEGSISNSVYNFTLSTNPETPLTENDVMLASATEISVGSKNVNLNFKHKLVKVVVQLSDANGQPITGAQLKINNQQLAGSLNLSDATVTSTGVADGEMPFAANASTSGQYQTIVMPSAPVQGRYIEVIHEGKTYTLPVDNQEFVSGKKLTFTATLNADGTAEPGQPITVIPSVSEWNEEKIESGWILTGEISVEGKNAKQLASNIQLNSGEDVVINNFTGTLNQNDIYCISYTRADGSTLSTDITKANITISSATGESSKTYTLPAGQAEGKLLIKVGENTSGISITTTDSGITLSDITVYTSSDNVTIPITLWEGNAENKEIYNVIGLVNIKIEETNLTELKIGAKLRIYYTPCDANQGASLYSAQYTEGNYTSSKTIIYDSYNSIEPYNNEYITVYLLNQLIEEIKENNNSLGISGTNCHITKVVLIPASGNEDVNENTLWKGRCQTYSIWNSVNLWLPEEISTGGTLRVNFEPAQHKVEGEGGTIITKPLLGGFLVITYPKETRTEILKPVEIENGATSQDFVITNEVLQNLQENIFNINRLSIYDKNETGGLAITSVEYIPA